MKSMKMMPRHWPPMVANSSSKVPTCHRPTRPLKSTRTKGIAFCPGKAANAGGVAVSGLEMTQNSMRTSWTREEVDEKLKGIMKHIYSECITAAKEYCGSKGTIQDGANIAGFLKVADSVIEQGCV